MKRRPSGYVYALKQAFYSGLTKSWHPTGNSGGVLYQSLASAQAVVDLPWVKDQRRNVWRTERNDIISKEAIYP